MKKPWEYCLAEKIAIGIVFVVVVGLWMYVDFCMGR